ncbi:MAG: hypothetical protein GTO18_18260 [Anaerolineales bacterium]|nr:hypothetical protein [Anaerolineales bacterium]
MSRVERYLIGIIVGILCPATLFILFWWTSAALLIFGILPLPNEAIVVSSFIGLILGILLDIRYLKSWVDKFYTLDARLLAIFYIFWSAAALGLFMGLPIGNLIWGTLAGVYVGRRGFHAQSEESDLRNNAKYVGILTASLTGIESLVIGLLALQDAFLLETVEAITRTEPGSLSGSTGVIFALIVGFIIAILQFTLTYYTALFAYRLRGGELQKQHV